MFPPLIHTHVTFLFSLLTLFSSSLIPVTFYLHSWKTNQEAGLSWPHKDPSSPLQLPCAHTLYPFKQLTNLQNSENQSQVENVNLSELTPFQEEDEKEKRDLEE